MQILILGDTVFLGRAFVTAALARGHQVTLFNRGQTHPGLFPEVEQLHGDREKDVSVLQGRRWGARSSRRRWRAILDWLPERPDRPWRAGIPREREAELLAAWKQQATA